MRNSINIGSYGESHYDPIQWMHFFQSPLGGPIVRGRNFERRMRELQRRERQEWLPQGEGILSALRNLFRRRRADVAT